MLEPDSQTPPQTPAGNDGGDTATAFLRARTRADHEAVDAAFGGFGLDTPAGYGAFLTAHARILAVAERVLDPGALLPGWEGRTQALQSDLASLAIAWPAEIDLVLPAGEAARWGAIYVLEGSRLGGLYLSRAVPEPLPKAYLSAKHVSGGWKQFLDRLDQSDTGPAWRAEALAGARALFAAYISAAAR